MGLKPDTLRGAGNNLVASAVDGDMRLISVVLGTQTDAIRFRESEKLLTWGFRFYETVTPIKSDKPFAQQRVWFGEQSQVNLGVAKDAAITVPKGQMKTLRRVHPEFAAAGGATGEESGGGDH